MLLSNKLSVRYLIAFLKQIRVSQVVVCPGSRNLPLIINFTNDPSFEVFTVIDERSAGFIALGLAKSSRKPVPVVTTSGSAAINLGPAIAEAYYQNIPLIAITADRPKELINKGENQTIIQNGLFKNYIGFELELDENIDFESFESRCKDLNQFLATPASKGTVHINMPFSEPLGETENILGDYRFNVDISNGLRIEENIKLPDIKSGQNGIIYLSTDVESEALNEILQKGIDEQNWIVISEIHSNFHSEALISHIDSILNSNSSIECPDYLITIGGTMLSKNFRNYIKSLETIKHIDISSKDRVWDTLSSEYQCIVQIEFQALDKLYKSNLLKNTEEFSQSWIAAEQIASDYCKIYHKALKYKEISIIYYILNSIKSKTGIFWGNSSAIRYGNWSNWKQNNYLTHYSNRGVSGIDGVLSTAIGVQVNKDYERYFCILGDIGFLYELTSLQSLSYIENMVIIVLNNKGGQIFESIHDLDCLYSKNTITTPQNYNLEKIAQFYDLEYFKSIDLDSFIDIFSIIQKKTGKILFEIQITNESNWSDYFK